MSDLSAAERGAAELIERRLQRWMPGAMMAEAASLEVARDLSAAGWLVTPVERVECACPDDETTYLCIGGIVYGPCGHENCYGACELSGDCTCQAETHKPGCHGQDALSPTPPAPAPPASSP